MLKPEEAQLLAYAREKFLPSHGFCPGCDTDAPGAFCECADVALEGVIRIVERQTRTLDRIAYYASGMACNLTESAMYRAKGDLLYDLAAGLLVVRSETDDDEEPTGEPRAADLKAENKALREAIQTHQDRILAEENNPNPADHTLWGVLSAKEGV